MRFYYRVSLWPAVLVVFCLISGVCVFIGRYPWVSLAVLVCVVIGGAGVFKDIRGVWPWQVFHRRNPDPSLEREPGSDEFAEALADMLKRYRYR